MKHHSYERSGHQHEDHRHHPAQHEHGHRLRDGSAAAAQGHEAGAGSLDNPAACLDRTTASPAAAPPGTIYTCPMHPEIRQPEPGNCPICGMALEPAMPVLDEGEHPELVDFRRRFRWTLPLTVAVALLAMTGHRISPNGLAYQNWVEFSLGTPVVLWAGWPFFARGVRSIRNRSPNMWTLISLGVAAAYGYSVVATFAPGLFPSGFAMHGRVGVYYEAAAVIVSLTLLGQILGLRARRPRARSRPCSVSRPGRPDASVRTAARKASHCRTCTSATRCACDRARRSRSTVRSSKAKARWTNPC